MMRPKSVLRLTLAFVHFAMLALVGVAFATGPLGASRVHAAQSLGSLSGSPSLAPLVGAPAETAAPTIVPEAAGGPAAAATSAPTPLPLPESAAVEGVVGHRQALPLSCEARSASDWAAFFGAVVREREFLRALPESDDPDRGFVGSVRGAWGQIPPAAYGVHAGPVARLLRDYGLAATARRYLPWETVQAEIAAGRPVIVWVVGHIEDGEPEVYTAADGRRTIVARFEHTVIVVGYTAERVTVVDGAWTYSRPRDQFLRSWSMLRNMAVIAGPVEAGD
jgi:uncharacterized protein YvpB